MSVRHGYYISRYASIYYFDGKFNIFDHILKDWYELKDDVDVDRTMLRYIGPRLKPHPKETTEPKL